MAGSIAPNTTGTNQPDAYVLGRGIVYLAPLGANDVPGAYRDLGNCTAFTVGQETEVLTHKSSRSGLKVTDKKVTLSQEIQVGFTLDQFIGENLGLFLSGTLTTHTNPAVAGVAEQVAKYTSVELGKWYDLTDGSGNRVYGIDAGDLVLEKDDTSDVLLVLNTDYELDAEFGRFRLLPTASNITAGDDVNVTITADANAPVVNEIRALQSASTQYALKFIGENPADGDKKYEIEVHKVTLTPDGEANFIGDEFATMSFTGVAEESTNPAVANSPFITVREHAES